MLDESVRVVDPNVYSRVAEISDLIFLGLFDTLYESCHWLVVYRMN